MVCINALGEGEAAGIVWQSEEQGVVIATATPNIDRSMRGVRKVGSLTQTRRTDDRRAERQCAKYLHIALMHFKRIFRLQITG